MVRSAREALPLFLLLVFSAAALREIPGEAWRTPFGSPCHFATVAGLAAAIGLTVTSLLGDRGLAVERVILSLFLGAMPLVYVASWFASPPASLARLGIEVLAVPLYGSFAVLGLRGSRWWLVVGIAAHGLCWDAWHDTANGVVPEWYAMACLVLDLGIAAYAAARIWTNRGRSATVTRRFGPCSELEVKA
jgi:hypothetical protein